MCKFLILVDLEGIIGVKNLCAQKHNCKLLCREIDFVVRLLFQYHVTICLIHNAGEDLNDIKKSLDSKNRVIDLKMLLEEKEIFEYAILIGFHGKYGASGCFPHSFRGDIIQFQYEGKIMGEVGAFVRWLSLKGTKVLLVSGEGSFADEVEGCGCFVHTFNSALNDMKMEDEYEILYKTLQKALDNLENVINTEHYLGKIVSIKLDNSDKYQLLSNLPYNYVINNDEIIFGSLDDFFSNLLIFCKALNEVNFILLKRNIEVLTYIKKKSRSDVIKNAYTLKKYFDMDIQRLTEMELKKIADIVGINYDSMY